MGKIVEKIDGASHGEIALLTRHWKSQSSTSNILNEKKYNQRLIVLCDLNPALYAQLVSTIKQASWLKLSPGEHLFARYYQIAAMQLFEEIKKFLIEHPGKSLFIQIVSSHKDPNGAVYAGLMSLITTAYLESSRISGQFVYLARDDDIPYVVDQIQKAMISAHDGSQYIDCRQEKVLTAHWHVIQPEAPASCPWRAHGAIYLIIGGLGGIGRLLVDEILQKCQSVTLVIVGCTPLNQNRQNLLDEWRTRGAIVDYHVANIADKSAVQRLFEHIKGRFGCLHGIIHSAGIIHDNLIIKKSFIEFQAVLIPKVIGLYQIIEASKTMALDFLLVFSSHASVIGSIGQADYAVANGFMDAYLENVYQLGIMPNCHRLLVINWSLWHSGGMQVDEKIVHTWEEGTGQLPIPTAKAMEALYSAYALDNRQVMVVYGNVPKITKTLLAPILNKLEIHQRKAESITTKESLHNSVIMQLRALLEDTVGYSFADIDTEQSLDDYPLDSIMIHRLHYQLSKEFDNIPITLWYQCRTLTALANYLIKHEQSNCERWSAYHSSSPEEAVETVVVVEQIQLADSKINHAVEEFTSSLREPIAIIGMSGRYPQAENLIVHA